MSRRKEEKMRKNEERSSYVFPFVLGVLFLSWVSHLGLGITICGGLAGIVWWGIEGNPHPPK